MSLTTRPTSSNRSTACASESTVRSCYETQLSADESVANPVIPCYYRPSHFDIVPSKHICPRCCSNMQQNYESNFENRHLLYYTAPLEHSFAGRHCLHSTL